MGTRHEHSDWIQLGMLIATFFVVIVALFGEKFREWLKRPKISIEFDKKSDRCFREATVPIDSIQKEPYSPFVNVTRVYYRLMIKNDGGLAKNVKVKIDLFDSEEKEIPHFEPSTLNWISGKERVDLARKEVNYVNICSQVTDSDEKILRVVPIDEDHLKNTMDRRLNMRLRLELFDTSQRGIIWDLPLNDYIFKITIYGNNFKPIPKKNKYIKPSNETNAGNLETIKGKGL